MARLTEMLARRRSTIRHGLNLFGTERMRWMATEKTDLRQPLNGHLPPFAPSSPAIQAFRTRAAHSGEENDRSIRPLTAPIHQSSVYAFADAELADAAFAVGDPLYARDGLPNVRALERAVADLEGVETAQ